MKTTRFILVGLVTLMVGIAVWLQADSKPKMTAGAPASATRTNSDEPAIVTKQQDSHASVDPSKGAEEPVHGEAHRPATLGNALALPAGFERQQLLERFGFDAAEKGAEAALQTLASLVAPADRVAFLRGMFAKLASGDPAENARVIKSLPEGIEREAALAALVANLRSTPLSPALQGRWIERFGNLGGLLAGLLDNPSLAAEYAGQLLTGMEKARVLAAAAAREVARDPRSALAFGAGLEGKERHEFLVGLASGWGSAAGDAAWAWSLQEPDAALRDAMQAAIIDGWSTRDPRTAALHVSQIAGDEARQKAMKSIGADWAEMDTQAAMAWAASLANPQERAAVAEAISASAPVGIGVALATGSEGYPIVRELIPGGPASAAGGLKDGYQIAAIGDGSGRFTDLRGKDLESVASMLRGKAGSNVWIQVVNPGGDRSTIVITRQQLLFKRPPRV
jgi:hypothetical protein